MSRLGFGPTTGSKCRFEQDRAHACRVAPIQLAAGGGWHGLWAIFCVADIAPLAGAVVPLTVAAMAPASITLACHLDSWKPLQQLPYAGSSRP